MYDLSRREFLHTAASVAAATSLPAWFLNEAQSAAPIAKNDEPLRLALIGCGGRGRGVAGQAARHGRMVAVCDVDDANLAEARKLWPDAAPFKDFRKLLEQPGIDVIVNGTPDHWHTLVNIAALRSGRDVYSEKPLTLTIDEGKRLVQVVRDTGRILQTGSQQRSEKNFRLACELVRNHRLGRLQHVDVWLPHGRSEGPFESRPVPTGFDWDMWQGQTPHAPFVTERAHVTFRYWWEYSGGTLTDWGAHHLDIALWGTGFERSGPASIEAQPLVEMIPGGFTAFSEYEVRYVYPNGVTQTCRSTTANAWNGTVLDPNGQQHGVKFTGSDGWIFVTRGKIEASDPELLTTPLPADALRLDVSDDHMQNFIDAVRSRKPPLCDAEIGHRSVSVCHLGVIALRLGRKLQWDAAREQFVGDAEADRWLSREMRAPWSYDSIG
ncbi:MAG: Gfo/Idh/MocA family oxidoreductase [Planctomycetaceae bacterium]|nr:Gfo/Idh/MocA family oxidoreductase [Planctomycetaceae bacterium]